MSNLEILAILENLRLRYPEHDYIMRVASACVARCFGYHTRNDWTGELSRLGLVDYADYGCAAEMNYFRLIEKADALFLASQEVAQ